MMRRGGMRRVLKWAGTVVCVLLAGLLALSARYQIDWSSPSALVLLSDGAVHCVLVPRQQPAGLRAMVIRPAYGWHVERTTVSEWRARLRRIYWLPHVGNQGTITAAPWTSVTVPIWIPLLVIAIPTAFLWWRDRRRIPPGHCQTCGYNLTGNVSGRCPECGTVIPAKA